MRARAGVGIDQRAADNNRIGQRPNVAHVLRTAQPEADGWRIQVEDNGVGLDPEDCEAVFQPFARIHGRKHAGVRLVQEGATLMPVLDAHKGREAPYKKEDLLGYRDAKPPKQEQEAMHRRKVMRKARSKKHRGELLAERERRYLATP